MSSYTNVNIPNRFDSITQLRERVHELNNKISWLHQQLDVFDRVLSNIPRAILEHGYVEITYENKTLKIGQIP